jgi:hypothetical protein
MLLGARLKLKEISIVRALQLASLIGLLLAFGGSGLWAIGLAVSVVTLLGYALILLYVRREVGLRASEIYLFPLLAGTVLAYPLWLFDSWFAQSMSPGSSIETSLARVGVYLVVLPLVLLGSEALVARERLMRYIAAVRSRM